MPKPRQMSVDDIIENIFMLGVQHMSRSIPEIDKLQSKQKQSLLTAILSLPELQVPPESEWLNYNGELLGHIQKATSVRSAITNLFGGTQ